MTDIPVGLALRCSVQALEEILLSRENMAANLEKQALTLIRQAVDERVQAEFARYMIVNRDKIVEAIEMGSLQEEFDFAAPKQIIKLGR